MQHSSSVLRQGTFDTGKAVLDKRGGIRRGEVDLPVVGEVHAISTSGNSNSNQGHTNSTLRSRNAKSQKPPAHLSPRKTIGKSSQHDSGLSGPSLQSDKEVRASEQDKGTQGAASRSHEAATAGAVEVDGSRYVDHNQLFKEVGNQSRWEDRDTPQHRSPRIDRPSKGTDGAVGGGAASRTSLGKGDNIGHLKGTVDIHSLTAKGSDSNPSDRGYRQGSLEKNLQPQTKHSSRDSGIEDSGGDKGFIAVPNGPINRTQTFKAAVSASDSYKERSLTSTRNDNSQEVALSSAAPSVAAASAPFPDAGRQKIDTAAAISIRKGKNGEVRSVNGNPIQTKSHALLQRLSNGAQLQQPGRDQPQLQDKSQSENLSSTNKPLKPFPGKTETQSLSKLHKGQGVIDTDASSSHVPRSVAHPGGKDYNSEASAQKEQQKVARGGKTSSQNTNAFDDVDALSSLPASVQKHETREKGEKLADTAAKQTYHLELSRPVKIDNSGFTGNNLIAAISTLQKDRTVKALEKQKKNIIDLEERSDRKGSRQTNDAFKISDDSKRNQFLHDKEVEKNKVNDIKRLATQENKQTSKLDRAQPAEADDAVKDINRLGKRSTNTEPSLPATTDRKHPNLVLKNGLRTAGLSQTDSDKSHVRQGKAATSPLSKAEQPETTLATDLLLQLDEDLLEFHEGSAPPQDHKKGYSRGKGHSWQGASQRSESSMSTLTAGPRKGGGDSITEIILERDQLLRNERTYQQRILQLEEEVKAVVVQSQELSSENRLLRQALDGYEGTTSAGTAEVEEMRRAKEALSGEVSSLRRDKQQVEAENEQLRARLAEQDVKTKQLDHVFLENTRLKAKHAELERKMQTQVKEKEEHEKSVQVTAATSQNKLLAVQQENTKMKDDLANLKTQYQLLEEKAEKMEVDNKDLEQKLEQKKTELEEVMRAMKTETAVERELKEVSGALEVSKGQLEDYKQQVDDLNRRREALDQEKDAAKEALRQKESELKGLKTVAEDKDLQIADLKKQLENAKRNLKRLEDEAEDSKQMEKDAVSLKARIRSLKTEVEDTLSANQRLKQEKAEARQEADRLGAELATATEGLAEAKRQARRLEGERKTEREKHEEEVAGATKRQQELERQLYDANVRSEQFKKRVQELEEERDDLLKGRGLAGMAEMELVSRRLAEDNKKLRQMLVERNIEIAQRQTERSALAGRVETLERKQDDAAITMQQLKGWVDTALPPSLPRGLLPALPLASPRPSQPSVLLPPVTLKGGGSHGLGRGAQRGGREGGGGRGSKRKTGAPRHQQQQQRALNRSWEDLGPAREGGGDLLAAAESQSLYTAPSLPAVVADHKVAFLAPTELPRGPQGYYHLYRNKMRLLHGEKRN